MITFQELTDVQVKGLIREFGNKTIAEIFANETIKENIEDNFVIDDDSLKLKTLKNTNVNLYEAILLELANTQADVTSQVAVKTYNEMTSTEKFAELKKNVKTGDEAMRLRIAKYEDCYVSFESISNMPSEKARGANAAKYQILEGEGFVTIADVIKKDGTAQPFDREVVKAISREQKLSATQFAYVQDLVNAGVSTARVKIAVESKKNNGVRRYRWEELEKSLNNGKPFEPTNQLGKEARAWFNDVAIDVPSPQGKVKMVIVGIPTTNSDIEVSFYPFHIIDKLAQPAVNKRFEIRAEAALNESTTAERIANAAISSKVMLAEIKTFTDAGLDPALVFSTIYGANKNK